jgi:hypothetical protein
MPTVLSFSEYLRELARQEDEFIVPAEEVARLETRFGAKIHGVGQWNADGSLTMSRTLVSEALRGLGKQTLIEAAIELEPHTTLANALGQESSDAARTIIERLTDANRRRLWELMTEFENTPESDPKRLEELRRLIDRAVFPQ